MEIEEEGGIKSFSTPRLNALEKLYVRVYLNTLSHHKAYESVNPGLKHYPADNPYSRKENVKFHISLKLQEQAEALSLTPELILSQLLKEATREGAGSNHAARIQALQILGKHLGMFVEKKEDVSHTIQIINYGNNVDIKEIKSLSSESSSELDEVKERTEQLEDTEDFYLPSNINIEDYSNVEA
jgi:hypothetical protein